MHSELERLRIALGLLDQLDDLLDEIAIVDRRGASQRIDGLRKQVRARLFGLERDCLQEFTHAPPV